jgi:hypothetical protein
MTQGTCVQLQLLVQYVRGACCRSLLDAMQQWGSAPRRNHWRARQGRDRPVRGASFLSGRHASRQDRTQPWLCLRLLQWDGVQGYAVRGELGKVSLY